MRKRNIVLLAVVLVLAVFALANRHTLGASASFSFLIGAVDLPIGLVVLGAVGAVILGCAIYMAIWQRTVLIDYRRQAKELQEQRSLADDAEASRFTGLGTLIREELARSNQRIDAAIAGLRTELKDTENSIAATLGEMDDRYRLGEQPLQSRSLA